MRLFRHLKPSEIECRISEISKDGAYLKLLLYKTARTDAQLLDETVSPGSWQNDFKIIDGNLYGGIGIDFGSGYIPICSAYGDIVPDYGNSEIKGQMSMNDIKGTANVSLEDVKLKTTGCNRTGCMFCVYGCHLEKHGEGRFLKLKQTHPQVYEYIMRSKEKGGLGFKEVLDWLNEHGNLHIEY